MNDEGQYLSRKWYILMHFIWLKDSDAEPIISRNNNRKFGNPSKKGVIVGSKPLKNAGAIISEVKTATEEHIQEMK
jgi:hypothetical protein